MHAPGIFAPALIFPVEGHASLIGELHEQVSVGIDEMLADIQRIGGLHHVALSVVPVADQFDLLVVLPYGHAAYTAQPVGLHFQVFATGGYDARQTSGRSVLETDAEPVPGGNVRHHAVSGTVLGPAETVLKSPDVGEHVSLRVERPEKLFLAVKIGTVRFQHGQEGLAPVGVAEKERPFLQRTYAQVVAVMPVVAQRPVHGGIAVIGTLPDNGDGSGQLEVHIGMVHPACGGIHRLAECPALDGLENIRQFVLSFLSQPVDQILKLVAQLFPQLAQSLETEPEGHGEHVDGGRASDKHRLSYRGDGGQHGRRSQERLAHLLGLAFAGDGRYSHYVARECGMRQGRAGGTVGQHRRAAHPHFGLGHAADQRRGVQDVRRQVHDTDSCLRDPLVVDLDGRRHSLEYASRHTCQSSCRWRHGCRQPRHEVRHEVVHLSHVRHGHDR